MTTNNSTLYSLKIISELIRDVLYFPLWWYTRGLMNLIQGLGRFLSNEQKSWALLVWMKNVFRPMYGQRDWQGIMISVFMRLVQIIFRSIVMLIMTIISLSVLLFWLLLPLLVFFEILYQLNLFQIFS